MSEYYYTRRMELQLYYALVSTGIVVVPGAT